jgi:hypothetical protein
MAFSVTLAAVMVTVRMRPSRSVTMPRFLPTIFFPLSRGRDNGNYAGLLVMRRGALSC